MQKTLRSSLAFLLVISMFITSIPLVANAEEDAVISSASVQQEEELQEEVHVVSEIIEKREPNMKYFRMSDGTITAAVYPYDVHYEEDGQMLDIDNTLVADKDNTDNIYENKNNETRVKFMKKSNPNS